jgi:hypothetical protein
MTDAEIVDYLEDNGYPPHIVRAGRKGLIERWSDFVVEIEHGYRYRLDDYRHDLDLRGAIATIGLADECAVQQADDRLRTLLTGEVRVWESYSGDAFWDFGYPRNASGSLLSDLQSAGFVETP